MKRLPKRLTMTFTALVVVLASVPGVPAFSALAQVAAPMAPAPLSEATVQALQQALNQQGIAVRVDGVLNEETRAAIRAFQSQHHLPVTGEPDKATLEKLGVSAPGSAAAGMPPAPGQAMAGPGMRRREMSGMMGPMMRGRGMMESMMDPHGMMTGNGPGRGMVVAPIRHLSVEEVRHFLEHWLAEADNPRIKVGAVEEIDDERIVADIVTQEGSLVDRFEVDRHTGEMARMP